MIYVCIVRTLCGRHKPDPCRTCIGPTVEICKSSQCLNHKKLQMELEETPTKCIHIQTKIWAKLLVLQTTATGALTKSASSLGSFQRSVCCCAKCPNQQRMDYQYYQSTKKLPVRYWLGACQIQAVLKIAVLKGWWSCSDGLESSCRSFCSFMRKSPKNTVGQFLNEAFPEFPSDPSWESSTCHRFRIGQIDHFSRIHLGTSLSHSRAKGIKEIQQSAPVDYKKQFVQQPLWSEHPQDLGNIYHVVGPMAEHDW